MNFHNTWSIWHIIHLKSTYLYKLYLEFYCMIKTKRVLFLVVSLKTTKSHWRMIYRVLRIMESKCPTPFRIKTIIVKVFITSDQCVPLRRIIYCTIITYTLLANQSLNKRNANILFKALWNHFLTAQNLY